MRQLLFHRNKIQLIGQTGSVHNAGNMFKRVIDSQIGEAVLAPIAGWTGLANCDDGLAPVVIASASHGTTTTCNTSDATHSTIQFSKKMTWDSDAFMVQDCKVFETTGSAVVPTTLSVTGKGTDTITIEHTGWTGSTLAGDTIEFQHDNDLLTGGEPSNFRSVDGGVLYSDIQLTVPITNCVVAANISSNGFNIVSNDSNIIED